MSIGFKQMERHNLREHVTGEIRQAISQGKLRIGDKLPAERELAVQLGVSRVALREALKELEATGIITVQVGRGTFVTSPIPQAMARPILTSLFLDEDTVHELMETRRIVESHAAGIAARRATAEDIAELTRLVGEMDHSADQLDVFYTLDALFHERIVQCTRNKILMQVLNAIRDVMVAQQKEIVTIVPDHNSSANGLHRAILEGISQAKPAVATKAMLAHLDDVESILLRLCAQKQSEGTATTVFS